MNLKKSIILILLLTTYLPLCFGGWYASYNIINSIDTGIYIRYATNNQFHEDVFLSDIINEQTGVYDTLRKIINEQDTAQVDTKQQLYKYILDKRKAVTPLLEENEAYVNYLKENELSLDDLFSYLLRMSQLDNSLMTGWFYIIALIEFLIVYFVLRMRIPLLIMAFVLYIFVSINSFTQGISNNMLYPSFTHFYSLQKVTLKYEEYLMLMNNFMPAIKEALLTYIIIDAVGQYFRDRKEKTTSQQIKQTYYALLSHSKNLKSMKASVKNLKVGKLKEINLNFLYRFCNQHKTDSHLKKVKLILNQNKEVLLEKSTLTSIDLLIETLEEIIKELQKSKKFKMFL